VQYCGGCLGSKFALAFRFVCFSSVLCVLPEASRVIYIYFISDLREMWVKISPEIP